jgi:ABC-type multidrug transport system fused ATPase/permease subunit
LIYLDPSWHDREENSIGPLTTLLSTDITELRSLTSNIFASIIQAGGGLVFGIGIAIYMSWRLTLTTFILFPIFGVVQFYIISYLKRILT